MEKMKKKNLFKQGKLILRKTIHWESLNLMRNVNKGC